jgi:uncharacterized protein YndB with AHSA1/START domain
MVEQQQHAPGLAVRQSVVVEASPERAFFVFTDGMTSWWPVDSHSIGDRPMAEAVIEPRTGGRWYERGDDGTECDWGRVLAWEPPARVVLAWQISADWEADPDVHTEIEVRFTPQDDGRTRVDLEHRGLESFGERAEQMRAIFGSDGGWNGLLRRFAGATAAD